MHTNKTNKKKKKKKRELRLIQKSIITGTLLENHKKTHNMHTNKTKKMKKKRSKENSKIHYNCEI